MPVVNKGQCQMCRKDIIRCVGRTVSDVSEDSAS